MEKKERENTRRHIRPRETEPPTCILNGLNGLRATGFVGLEGFRGIPVSSSCHSIAVDSNDQRKRARQTFKWDVRVFVTTLFHIIR